jgi:hypothetical protein
MILEGIRRIQKNLESETDPDIKKDLKAVISGMSNFYFGLKTKLARERFEESCKDCEFNVKEPIEDMRVKDSIIPELSNKQCGLCGCVLSYKIRQSVKKCPNWK